MIDVKHLVKKKPDRTVVIYFTGEWIFNAGAGLFFVAVTMMAFNDLLGG